MIGNRYRDGFEVINLIVNREDLSGMMISMPSQADAIDQHVGQLCNACDCLHNRWNYNISIACDISSRYEVRGHYGGRRA